MSATRRWRDWAPMALVVALLLATGLAILDDYGFATDERMQRTVGLVSVDYALGISDTLLTLHDRHYGAAFEAPLYVIDRLLGLDDERHIHLVRHFLTHAFFLAGAVFSYLLAHRLFGSRALAMFALLVFVLHPRLYAHSFFNSKDIPFLVAFMAALFLLHRAFRLGTVGAFALCGAAAGVLAGIRLPGMMLLAAVPMLCAIQWAVCPGAGDAGRRGGGGLLRPALQSAAFLAVGLPVLFAATPYLWGDPLDRIAESLARFAHYGFDRDFGESELFKGEHFAAADVPASYFPTWFAISAPPATLLLGMVGAGAVVWRSLARPRDALCDADLRFGVVLVVGFALPAAVVAALGSTLYDGWRHLYFLYAPFAVLSIFGLHWLTSALGRTARLAACGLLAVGLAATVVEMAAIHPHQNVYFNALVDRATPGQLRRRYDMDYYRVSLREALEELTERVPSGPVHVRSNRSLSGNLAILPRQRRERVILDRERAGYYLAASPTGKPYYQGWSIGLFPPAIWERKVYGSAITTLAALDLSAADAATVDRYREMYRSAVAGEPLIEAEYDVYLSEGNEGRERRLFYARSPCGSRDVADAFILDVTPVSAADLPASFRPLGFTSTHPFYAVHFDDKCLASVRLPPYPIAHFGTGQYQELGDHPRSLIARRVAWARGHSFGTADADAGAGWRAWTDYWMGGAEWQEWIEDQAPAAAFDVVVAQRPLPALTYEKADCTLGEQHAPFFLHLRPRRIEDLPRQRRALGFDRLEFRLAEHGGRIVHSRCFASVPLPDYDLETLTTGQWTGRRGTLWEVELVP